MIIDQLIGLDLTTEIDRIPRKPGYETLAPRSNERYITFHYSAVVYTDRSEAAERKRVLDEAAFQINKNWASPGQVYGDGLMYDLVVFSSGLVVRTRKRRQKLWHCNNTVGNGQSWSVHVMLGPGQDLFPAQRTSLFRVFDALCADSSIPRSNVVAHCEWPLINGAPVTSATYKPRLGQSACPGPVLFTHIPTYRAGWVPSASRWRVKDHLSNNPADNYAAVRVAPRRDADPACIGVNEVRLSSGYVVESDRQIDGWLHISRPDAWGYSSADLYEQVVLDTPLGARQ